MKMEHIVIVGMFVIIFLVIGLEGLFTRNVSAGGGEGPRITSDIKGSAFEMLNKTSFVMKAEPLGAELVKISQTGVYSGGTMTAVYRVKNYSKTANYTMVVKPEFKGYGTISMKWLNPEALYLPGTSFILGQSSERDLEFSLTVANNFYGIIAGKVSMFRIVKAGEVNFYNHSFEVDVEPVEVKLIEATRSDARPGQGITQTYLIKNHSALVWSITADMKIEMENSPIVESRWTIDGSYYAPGNPFIINPGQEVKLKIVIFPPEGEEIPATIEIYRFTVPVEKG